MQIRNTTTNVVLSVAGVEQEFEAKVQYTYYPPVRGQREKGSGIPLEPDSPAEVELDCCLIQDEDYTLDLITHLSADQLTALEDEILEGLS